MPCVNFSAHAGYEEDIPDSSGRFKEAVKTFFDGTSCSVTQSELDHSVSALRDCFLDTLSDERATIQDIIQRMCTRKREVRDRCGASG